MDNVTDDAAPGVRRPRRRRLQRWPAVAGYAALFWSVMYGTLGLYWTVGGVGFPFGVGNDPGAELSVFAGVTAEIGAPAIAAIGLIGSVVAVAMIRTWGHGLTHATVLAFGWTVAATLALVVPDYRVLVVVAYTPIFVFGAPFGWSSTAFFAAVTWPLVNQLLCIVGGFSWGLATLAYQRRSREACENCGRADTVTDGGWTTPNAAARWGLWATTIAVSIPLLYAITRWAWFLGVPLGITDEFFREGQASGAWAAGAALGTLAAGGAVLTLGLVQSWGEVFPRWMPFVGDTRVPIWLAVVPAALATVLVTTAGLMFVRLHLTGVLGELFGDGNWAAIAPELLWPIWGVALGGATLAYYYRRRGRCRRCGRSSPTGVP